MSNKKLHGNQKVLIAFVAVLTLVLSIIFATIAVTCFKNEDSFVTTTAEATTYICETTTKPKETTTETTTEITTETTTELETYSETLSISYEWEWLSEEEIELIALVTMAEAEGECEEGKRLVIDTILNRVRSEHWPDTVSEVIWQSGQFSVMWNGRIDRCYVSDDICRLVREEMYIPLNSDVVYFAAGGYSAYGTPMFQVGNHYFSSYD